MVESPTPQWFGTLDLESPTEVILPPLMAPAPVYPMISKTQMLDASSSGIIEPCTNGKGGQNETEAIDTMEVIEQPGNIFLKDDFKRHARTAWNMFRKK